MDLLMKVLFAVYSPGPGLLKLLKSLVLIPIWNLALLLKAADYWSYYPGPGTL